MFIQSYEKMRNYLYNQATIETLIQFEYSAFEEATVPVCTFAFQNRHIQKKGCYLRLVDFRGGMEVQRQKTLEAIENHDCGFYYEQSTDNFSKIPGSPVAYWVSAQVRNAFANNPLIEDVLETRNGMSTTNNNLFLKMWFEPCIEKCGFGSFTAVSAKESSKKWFRYNKGGEFRRWYGNNDYVVNWENDGEELKKYVSERYGSYSKEIRSEDRYFYESITWSGVTSSQTGFRFSSQGAIFDSGANGLFADETRILKYTLGFLNTKLVVDFVKCKNPTINTGSGTVGKLPICIQDEKIKPVNIIVDKCIEQSKIDWDSFETSWDFQNHPLLRKVSAIAEAFDQWQTECNDRFNQLKANEEELNRIFIEIYGLQDELTPEVEDKDVTVRKADLSRDIRSFISYAVGCMFGRYSIYRDGLVYAGGKWDYNTYEDAAWLCDSKPDVVEFYKQTHFMPDEDNIIPICDDEYFTDDIVGRFVEFVEAVYGADTLDENLKFIADALGGKGQPKDVIRNYFLSDFYSDHCKIYQKRPIYWLFDSGKKNGFKALIYMHRYQPDTIARIRTDYVHEQQARYRTAIADLEQRIANASTAERVKLNKKLTTLQAQDTEIRTYEEKMHHLADQMISIDLDDGVKKNYAIFQNVLAKIK